MSKVYKRGKSVDVIGGVVFGSKKKKSSSSNTTNAYEQHANNQGLDMGDNHPPVYPTDDGTVAITTTSSSLTLNGPLTGSQFQSGGSSATMYYPSCGSCHSTSSGASTSTLAPTLGSTDVLQMMDDVINNNTPYSSSNPYFY